MEKESGRIPGLREDKDRRPGSEGKSQTILGPPSSKCRGRKGLREKGEREG